jgi:hypothetical protein
MLSTLASATKGKWLITVLALLILTIAGCQQLEGNRVPSKSGKNKTGDPFLGSPLGRIPPTPMPATNAENGASLTMQPPSTLPVENARLVAGTKSLEGQHSLTAQTTEPFQPAGWSNPAQRSVSWEETFRQLRAKGITWQRLEMQGNSWRFECSVPDPQRPGHIREYSATASDPLGAVQAVLQKLENASR